MLFVAEDNVLYRGLLLMTFAQVREMFYTVKTIFVLFDTIAGDAVIVVKAVGLYYKISFFPIFVHIHMFIHYLFEKILWFSILNEFFFSTMLEVSFWL